MSEEQNNKNIIQMLYYVIKTYDTGISKEDVDSLDIMQQQLQAYKDKEDKLREYVLSVIKEHETGQYDVSTVGLAIKEHKGNIENILQILNEGSDK